MTDEQIPVLIYNGKPGAPDHALQPVGLGQPPFRKGVPRVMDDSYARAHGRDSGKALAEFMMLYHNRGLPEGVERFSLHYVSPEEATRIREQQAAAEREGRGADAAQRAQQEAQAVEIGVIANAEQSWGSAAPSEAPDTPFSSPDTTATGGM